MKKYHSEVSDLFEYLLKQELTVEELALLYTVYVRTEAPENTHLLGLLSSYYNRFKYYDQGGQPLGIPWSKIVQKLEREEFLISYPGHAKPAINGYSLDLSKLEVTNKFKKTLITDDREALWEYYISDIFGISLEIQGKVMNTLLPDKGETLDQMKERFWSLCDNGMNNKFRELCQNTREFFSVFDQGMKVTTFLKNYEANMLSLKLEKEKRASSGNGKSWVKTL